MPGRRTGGRGRGPPASAEALCRRRVEDTDQARSTRESEDAVLEDLSWLGIQWDEGESPCR